MRYAFPSDIVFDEEEKDATGREAYGVTFPDVPEAITCGWSWQEALDAVRVKLPSPLMGEG